MQYFWTFFWTFLLIHMVTYVVGSMIGYPYNFVTGSILGVGTTILVIIVASIIPNEPTGDHGHH